MSGRPAERGYSMVALVAAMAVMTILISVGVSGWRYVMQDAREEELLFRGVQIANAVKAFQAKNGGAYPPSLDVLVKGKYLRKAYKDPMTEDGKWRFLRPGEGATVMPAPGASPLPGSTMKSGPTGLASPRPGTIGGEIGVVAGVASRSTETSLRVVNGRTRYNEWLFLPGQVPVVGQPPTMGGNVKPPVRK